MIQYKDTKFGWILTHPNYEVMCFRTEGSDHIHDINEYATLLKGKCKIKVGDVLMDSQLNVPLVIPKNTPHKMIPKEESIFLISYY